MTTSPAAPKANASTEFKKGPIDGVKVWTVTKYVDERGWLAELFRHDELPKEFHPVMSYVSLSRAGVTRGPHEHVDQADLFVFLGPSNFRLILWDNRPDSPTFWNRWSRVMGEDSPGAIVVPKGVVHAYRNIGPGDGLVFNAPNQLFMGHERRSPIDEIRHEADPESPFRFDAP